ncbi:Unhealthy ribosome biogenesis protein 2 [Chionoecetes opilio]|uniref:Unhealthy ribosome biogenesis protein 2 n=1 Tax=Chionoecetes opilio TaxID=41210 RepID=A0A8J4XSX1_CHIOP|nr:Unhealthy ribosome biogenesis protein 2 [Chionoecetes opilio]
MHSQSKVELMGRASQPGDLEFVSVVVWMVAVVVEASPALQVATVAGDAGSLAEIMTQIAVSGIKPLVTVMLTHPHCFFDLRLREWIEWLSPYCFFDLRLREWIEWLSPYCFFDLRLTEWIEWLSPYCFLDLRLREWIEWLSPYCFFDLRLREWIEWLSPYCFFDLRLREWIEWLSPYCFLDLRLREWIEWLSPYCFLDLRLREWIEWLSPYCFLDLRLREWIEWLSPYCFLDLRLREWIEWLSPYCFLDLRLREWIEWLSPYCFFDLRLREWIEWLSPYCFLDLRLREWIEWLSPYCFLDLRLREWIEWLSPYCFFDLRLREWIEWLSPYCFLDLRLREWIEWLSPYCFFDLRLREWIEWLSPYCFFDLSYREGPSTPKVLPFNPSPPTDFSHLFPFILPDAWAQISARVANFGNKAAKLALVQLVIQKFSLASLEQQKGVLCQDPDTQEVGIAVAQKTLEKSGKYLTNALESWGGDVSCLLTVHLTYLLPSLHASHLSVIARHLVNGVKEGETSWNEYINSRHFEEASQLHPQVFSDICAVLATMFGSSKRKLSECEDGPSSGKSYCSKLLKKMSKAAPLLVEYESGKEEENPLWKLFEECGESLRKLIEKEQGQSCSVPRCNTGEFKAMIKLITKFPLQHLNRNLKTATLLVLFSLLVQESGPGREEHFFDLVYALNQALGYLGTFRIFTITKASSLMQWLIEKRVSLYGPMVSQHMANLPHAILKANGTYSVKFVVKRDQSCDVQNRYNFDHLVVYLTFKLIWTIRAADQVKQLAEHITSGSPSATEALLQPAVFLLAACHMKGSIYCKWARHHLSSWILRYLKKLDLATTCPATAATILTAHTIIVQAMAPTLARDKAREDAKSGEGAATDLKEDGEAVAKEDTMKKLKWKKLLRRSVQLSELCLSSGNQDLEEYALAFLLTVAKHSDVLSAYLPPQLLTTAWTALSCPERCPSGIDVDGYTKVSLEPVLLTASPEDYEKLLEDLVMRTHRDDGQLGHTLQLWRLVIHSMAIGANGFLKRTALEHLVPILVHLATVHGSTARQDSGQGSGQDSSLVHAVLLTLQEIIQTSISFEDQTKAHLLMPCTTVHLHKLPHHDFCKIFSVALSIVNSVVVDHSSVVVERTPAVLAALAHLTTALIAQASQEHKLQDKQIKELVGCSGNIERLVKELSPFKVKLNKVVHFTMATIVTDLQRTTVYPAVKMVIESVVYRLLDLCDDYCLQHLLVALPPATTTLLKHLHDNYSTFHRFNPGKA